MKTSKQQLTEHLRTKITERVKMQSFRQYLKEQLDASFERAASYVHDRWMERNPKADWNAHQHVPYEELPEEEKQKDRLHVQMIGGIALGNGLNPSNYDHHAEIIDRFGSAAHEQWRAGWEAKNGAGTPRLKSTSDGGQVNINVPWEELHPEWKKENIAAGKAALHGYNAHIGDNSGLHGRDSIQRAPIDHSMFGDNSGLHGHDSIQRAPIDHPMFGE